MKVAFYLNSLSPHQLPLAAEVARVIGDENFRYIYTDKTSEARMSLGWNDFLEGYDFAITSFENDKDENKKWLETADILYSGLRAIDLFEERVKKGRLTLYYSERWFKPISLGRPFGVFDFHVPGWVRLLVPSFFKMARRICALLGTSCFHYLAVGPQARKDLEMALCVTRRSSTSANIHAWGYFVRSSQHQGDWRPFHVPLRILWVGMMRRLKRVDTIIKAVRLVSKGIGSEKVQLTLVGEGPDCQRLKRIAHGMENVFFKPAVPISVVRDLMHENDVYVFASNGMDGWGAVVNEALEEKMIVFGTEETGASATLLPSRCRFKSGDVKQLANLILRADERCMRSELGEWTAFAAAKKILSLGGRDEAK